MYQYSSYSTSSQLFLGGHPLQKIPSSKCNENNEGMQEMCTQESPVLYPSNTRSTIIKGHILVSILTRYWIFKSSTAFKPYIVEKSVNSKSFLKFNLQAHRVIFRVPCMAVFLRFALFHRALCDTYYIHNFVTIARRIKFVNTKLL